MGIVCDEKNTATDNKISREFEKLCTRKKMRMTAQRSVIAKVLDESSDHLDIRQLHQRVCTIDDKISIATLYRTVRLLETAGILSRHDFQDGRVLYEDKGTGHHDHLIDIHNGRIIEFVDPDLEKLQEKIAHRLGYRLINHRLELYGIPLGRRSRS